MSRSLPAPRWLALGAAAWAAMAVWALAIAGPPGSGLPCAFHAVTGWHCPGCGLTRATRALLHGEVAAAFGHNAVGLTVVLFVSALLIRTGWVAVSENRWAPPRWSNRAGWWLLGVALLWALLRNLPWPPFTALAP